MRMCLSGLWQVPFIPAEMLPFIHADANVLGDGQNTRGYQLSARILLLVYRRVSVHHPAFRYIHLRSFRQK